MLIRVEPNNLEWSWAVRAFVQQQFSAGGVESKDGKIDSFAIGLCTLWIAVSGKYFVFDSRNESSDLGSVWAYDTPDTAFLMSIDYFVNRWLQGFAALRPC